MDDEAALLTRLREGDEQAFTRLFETQADRLFRLAAGLLGDDVEAEEVVQATFLAAFEALARFDGRARIGTWLYRIAYNHAFMILRRRRVDVALPDETAACLPSVLVDWSGLPETYLLRREAQQALFAALGRLPLSLRAACVLRDVEGLSTREAATVLNISEGAVKVRLHRARLALRADLSAYFTERARAAGGA